jgi:hypothetical protein
VAVGDLDGDDRPEVVAATMGETGWLFAWDRRGRSQPAFPVRFAGVSAATPPIIVDLDADGRNDILLAASGTLFDPTAALLGINRDGRLLHPFPIRLEGSDVIRGGPCVADLDGDGLLEILLGTEVQGQLLAWNLETKSGALNAPWPRPGFDSSNSCHYRPPALEPDPGRANRLTDEEQVVDQPPLSPAFSPLVTVSFVLREEGYAKLTIVNLQGEPVRTLLATTLPIGAYAISWDGTDGHGRTYPPGVYFYELDAPGKRASGQMLLLR